MARIKTRIEKLERFSRPDKPQVSAYCAFLPNAGKPEHELIMADIAEREARGQKVITFSGVHASE